MKKIDEVVNSKKCTSCSACFNICPVNAIVMEKDEEGFLRPKINKNKCINCKLCDQVCPIIKKSSDAKQYPEPIIFAGWNKNESIRKDSSSGGVFTLFANYFLNKRGYVCGASFDKNNHLRHIIISDKKDLNKLRGSKYVQSEIGKIYQDIKKLLLGNNLVLFSGTPCQVAGLKSFLKKDFKNLLTIEVVCHGTPSPLVFEEYLKYVEKINKNKIDKIEFRNKSEGWKNPNFILSNKEKNNIIKEILYKNTYGRGFLTNLFSMESCSNCAHAKIPRTADIALGDFWGVEKYNQKLDNNKGTSLIFINNDKGLLFYKKLDSKKLFFKKSIPLKFVANNNYPIIIPSEKHVNRASFFNEFKLMNQNIEELMLKNLDDNNDGFKFGENSVGILNFHYENYNFGALLVAYSLSQVIKNLGYPVKNINFVPFEEQLPVEKLCSLSFYKFRENFLHLTKICKIKEDLIKLNNQFDTFIVGSDQVWRRAITGKNVLNYFLDFVIPSKNIFSYGASFGHKHWEGDKKTTNLAKFCLKKFSGISVREKDGINILKNKFEIKDSSLVLDPTLLLSAKDYENLIKSEKTKTIPKKFIGCYFLFDFDKKVKNNKKLKDVAEKMNCQIINIAGEKKIILGEEKFVYNSIPSWLNYIKNSSLIVTDSYHGVIFSIIFKKNFICVGKKSKALSRFTSLFSILDVDVKNRFLGSLNDLKNVEFLFEKPNYNLIYKKLKIEQKKSLQFLKINLKPKKNKEEKLELVEKLFVYSKIKNMDLNLKLQNSEQSMQNLTQALLNSEENLKKTNESLQMYLNTKTFKYTRQIKLILKKIGINKFKI